MIEIIYTGVKEYPCVIKGLCTALDVPISKAQYEGLVQGLLNTERCLMSLYEAEKDKHEKLQKKYDIVIGLLSPKGGKS